MVQSLDDVRLAVVGLGYVGLPLAVEFGKASDVVGFDIKEERIRELKQGTDSTREVTADMLAESGRLSFSADPKALVGCNVYIVTVPTPIDEYKRPDLSPLEGASRTVGACLKEGDVVIYESTVFPRRHRRGLRSHSRKDVGPDLERGILRWLQSGADQSRRHGAPPA